MKPLVTRLEKDGKKFAVITFPEDVNARITNDELTADSYYTTALYELDGDTVVDTWKYINQGSLSDEEVLAAHGLAVVRMEATGSINTPQPEIEKLVSEPADSTVLVPGEF